MWASNIAYKNTEYRNTEDSAFIDIGMIRYTRINTETYVHLL